MRTSPHPDRLRSAAEAVLEHKATLGHYQHKVFYVREFVDKPGRDIRVAATDGIPVAKRVRPSDHWLTNAAEDATVSEFAIINQARDQVRRAAAVGCGLLGIDLVEFSSEGYIVHEVNSTCEFKALNRAIAEVTVPTRIVDWVKQPAGRGTS